MTRRRSEVSESDLEATLAGAFGMDLPSLRESRPMTEDQAVDVSLREAFHGSAGGGPTAAQLEEAQRVVGSTTPPAGSQRPGAMTTEVHEGLDQRIDVAREELCTLSESRLGMARDAAEGHARKIFSEMNGASSSKELLAQRLEYQVKGLRALPPLSSRGRS